MSKSTTPHRENASIRSGSNIGFSTFGYETPPPPPPVSSTYRLSTNPQSSIDTLDSDNANYHQRVHSIGPICHHHHQHQQFLQKQLIDQQQQMNEISWEVRPMGWDVKNLSSSSSSSHHHTKHHKRDCPAADDSNSNSTNTSKSSKKHSKNDEQQSKVFIDVGRHSAPDVIIMTH